MYNVKIRTKKGTMRFTGSRVKTFGGALNRVRRIIDTGYVGPVEVLKYKQQKRAGEAILCFNASPVTLDKLDKLNEVILFCLDNQQAKVEIDIVNDVISSRRVRVVN